MDFLAAHQHDFQLQAAVVEQQDVAADHVLGQVLVVEADPLLVAERAGCIEDETVADGQSDLAALEFADADLRPLQVAQDADCPTELGGRGANALGARLVILGAAMRKIHPDDIDAGLDQTFKNLRRRRGRPQRGDDLGMTQHCFPSPAICIPTILLDRPAILRPAG